MRLEGRKALVTGGARRIGGLLMGYDQEGRDASQPSGFNFFGPRRF